MSRSGHEGVVALLLIICVAVVAAWQIGAGLAARPYSALKLDVGHFDRFRPVHPEWDVRLMHVKATAMEPTVLAFELRRREADAPPVRVRLVHGYNMVDCMRIKHYDVHLLEDLRSGLPPAGLPEQVWRVTAPDGQRSIWVTTMLRAADFGATDVDTRAMAFPRIGTPDDPGWAPSGLRWSSFRHPVRNFRLFLRSKWNASRADWLTFLRLRQPAWASDVMLTLVSESRGGDVLPEREASVSSHVRAAHRLIFDRLHAYGSPPLEGDPDP